VPTFQRMELRRISKETIAQNTSGFTFSASLRRSKRVKTPKLI